MNCLHCQHKLEVINSRLQVATNQVWRRRRCSQCRRLYTSHESLELSTSLRISGRPFSRDQLFLSIYSACRHRPTATGDAAGLTATAIAAIQQQSQSGAIDRLQVTKLVAKILRRFDSAAAVQYQAFHKG